MKIILSAVFLLGLFSAQVMAQPRPGGHGGRNNDSLERKVDYLESELNSLKREFAEFRRNERREDRRDDRRGGGEDIQCNWEGKRWLSHGWMGNCAWEVGADVYCSNQKVVKIDFTGSRNGCNIYAPTLNR